MRMASFVYPHYVFAKEKGSRVDFPYVEKDAKDSLRFSYLHKTPAKKSEVHEFGVFTVGENLFDDGRTGR